MQEALRDKLLPFQRDGLDFCMAKQGKCLIGDEMGLGKTVQAIASAFAYHTEWPLLVVVPASMKLTWVDELERWLPVLQPGDIKLVASMQVSPGHALVMPWSCPGHALVTPLLLLVAKLSSLSAD